LAAQGSIEATVSWYGPGSSESLPSGSEPTVQAMCGLMTVHGRDRGEPRRLGLEAASVAAGILAAQGVLAALIGRSRGRRFVAVETSALQAGLLLRTHYISAATSRDPEWTPPPPADGPGPPFPTADGQWIEIETLDPVHWRSFWDVLGVEGPEVARGWRLFVQRYETATCSLPARLHDATARHSFRELREAAERCGVSLCRVREYEEMVREGDATTAGIPAWQIRPAGQPPGSLSAPRGERWGSPPTLPASDQAPLSGLRVVEATRRLQGPLAGLLLGMLGAEVVRVEPPGGDLTRGMPPLDGDIGAIFLALNRGKEPVELDPKHSAGRAALLDLLSEADVFIHNWRPGRAQELALASDDCARCNPRLIYAHATGWAGSRSAAGLLGTDYLVQAFTAMGDGLNPAGEPAFPSRVVLVDLMGALVACEGVLAGLCLREQRGGAWEVQTSLLGGAMALQEHVIGAIRAPGEHGRRMGRPLWGVLDRPLATAEGFLILVVEDTEAMVHLCEVCGVEAGEEAELRVAERLRERPAREWERMLRKRGVSCAVAVGDLGTLPAEPALRGLLESPGQSCRVPAPPWRFSTDPPHEA
jgi:crotonobetainyl-CoA:carnitine CoA-transferase CaiB-like acyl-CoA transferase